MLLSTHRGVKAEGLKTPAIRSGGSRLEARRAASVVLSSAVLEGLGAHRGELGELAAGYRRNRLRDHRAFTGRVHGIRHGAGRRLAGGRRRGRAGGWIVENRVAGGGRARVHLSGDFSKLVEIEADSEGPRQQCGCGNRKDGRGDSEDRSARSGPG